MIYLKLYGQPSSTYEYVKMMMLAQAQKAGVQLHIEEINDLDAILAEGLESIPTIKVNGHVDLRYRVQDDINDFVRALNTRILKEENFGLMKKIFVPTDFSETAENACAYAMGLAKDINGVVTVVHSYIPSALNMEGAVYIDPEIEKLRRQQLSDFVDGLNKSWVGEKSGAPLVQKEFLVGFAGKEIPALVENIDNGIIVIGSTGASGSLKTIFGSVTTMIGSEAKCPVFVIPPHSSYQSPGKIAYAADDPDLDEKAAVEIIEFASKFGSEINLVHVDDDDPTDVVALLEKKCRELSSDLFLKTHLVESDGIIEGLNTFVEKNDIDLLILSKKKRAFLDSLFHTSVTKRMTLNTKIPLLIIHR